MKTCSKCGEPKPLSQFSKDKAQKDGFYGTCKNCVGIKRKEYYQKNRAFEISKNSNWQKQNRKRVNATKKNNVAKLTDCYVREVLTKRTNLKGSDIPQELIDLKKEQLKIHRYLKENHE
jgi:hypothetical protein